MPNKKINQLDDRVGGSLTDLSLVGDPTTGTSFKLTLTQISTIMGVPGKFNQPTGTTSQYLRGDGSLATFPSFPVTSVFGRTGSVVATEGDYTLTQLGDVTLTSPTNGQVLKYNGTSWVNNTDTDTGLTSVGLTMPSAFSVANSPLTSSGTLAVTGAGTASQYIRGDGQLANFPDNQGGGSSVNYYLNGSVTQGTFGGVTYYEMSKTPVLGAGTNFTRTNAQGNGYIASFITDAGDPSLLNIPGGNWNVEFYFQSSASGGSPQFYAELYKVDASNNFTLIGSGSTNPEGITNGTTIDQYFTSIPVPQTSLLVTDRLAIRIFVIPDGRTITLHTENSNLCEVLTTLSTGLNALNGLTSQVQYFATGTSGTDFAISSATDTHTFNLPTASATNRGALSSADWTTFNSKQNALTNPITGTAASGQVAYFTGATTQGGSNNLFWDNTNGRLGIGTNTPTVKLSINNGVAGTIANFTDGVAQTFRITTGTGFAAIDNPSAGALAFQIGTTERMRLHATANFSIGSSSDSGQRLQVTGDTLLKGSGNTSGTTALTVQNSDSTNLFRVSNDNTIFLGGTTYVKNSTTSARFFAGGSFTESMHITAPSNRQVLRIVSGTIVNNIDNNSSVFEVNQTITSNGTITNVSNTILSGAFNSSSGSVNYSSLLINNSINQTGGANGITRGLYVNPTLTAAADWRSIEWSNNTGWGLYGAGTSANYLNGSLSIGTTTSAMKLTLIDSTTTYVAQFRGAASSYITVGDTSLAGESGINFRNSSGQGFLGLSGQVLGLAATSGANTIALATGGTTGAQLNVNRNFILQNGGTFVDGGERLQVNGTTRITGATSIGGNVTIPIGSYDLPALSFANDTNTGLFSPLADALELKTGTNNAVVLENAATNLTAASESLGSFPTNFQNIGISIPGNIVAPDGSNNANLAVPNTTSTQHRFFRILTLSEPYTISVYAKTAGYNFISLAQDGGTSGGTIIFDIVNGTISGTASGFSATIENVGNGWFRCSLTRFGTAGATSLSRWIIVRNANSTADYAGDGTSGVYLWGWQMETGAAATSYIATGASTVTRPQAVSILGSNLYGNLITKKITAPSFNDFSISLDGSDRMIIKGTTGNVGIGNDPTAALDIKASTTSAAAMRLRTGTAPTTPNDGDIWFDGTNIRMRIGGVTKTFTLV